MKPRTRLVLLSAALALLTFLADQWRRVRLEASQDENILAAAARHHVDPSLVKAVIWRESRFHVDARGAKRELGLMQVMPDTTGHDWAASQHRAGYAPEQLLIATNNIDCGAWYLHKLLGRYTQTDDPIPYALADYNAGRGNALRWMTGTATTNSAAFVAQITYPATREYIRAIRQRMAKYRRWADENTPSSAVARDSRS